MNLHDGSHAIITSRTYHVRAHLRVYSPKTVEEDRINIDCVYISRFVPMSKLHLLSLRLRQHVLDHRLARLPQLLRQPLVL